MVSQQGGSRRLGLSEAYHVVNRWLTHVGSTPRAIDEPVDGVVELIGAGFHARIRIDATPLPQGAVLALLRAVADENAERLMLWSVSDFTTGAVVFADTQGVSLFSVTPDGDVVPRNSHARLLMPAVPLEPAFTAPILPEAAADTEREDDVVPEREEPEGVAWRDCPRCGATHHPRANFCASCGADLHTRLQVMGGSGGTNIPVPSKLEDRSRVTRTGRGEPVPRPRSDAPTLRCRTCGSQDIELIHHHR